MICQRFPFPAGAGAGTFAEFESQQPYKIGGLMSANRLYLAAVVAVMACASGGTQGGPSAPRRSSLLTAVEIVQANADVNSAYDAIARLRPNWLASHGSISSSAENSSFASVWVDGQQAGDFNALRQIPAYQVGVIEYFDITQAGARFGVRAGGGGAIEVRMKKP